MPVAELMSVAEYLRTSYHPDREYVDGEILERHLGERKHSLMQRECMFRLSDLYPRLRKRIFPEHRVQVNSTRYRVPDLCITADGSPEEQIISVPPELCIEILSPEDTMSRTLEKVRDYLTMGVPTCWIIDPETGDGWIATAGRLDDATDGILRANGIELRIAEVME